MTINLDHLRFWDVDHGRREGVLSAYCVLGVRAFAVFVWDVNNHVEYRAYWTFYSYPSDTRAYAARAINFSFHSWREHDGHACCRVFAFSLFV